MLFKFWTCKVNKSVNNGISFQINTRKSYYLFCWRFFYKNLKKTIFKKNYGIFYEFIDLSFNCNLAESPRNPNKFNPAMANPHPFKLFNVALLQYLKNRLDLYKSPNFGPQNDDFSKMWPPSRFGLAMAGLIIQSLINKILWNRLF
jgi:hypothetical protein